MVRKYMLDTCPPMGVTAANIANWIEEVVKPWLRVAGAHLSAHPYLLGARPSLADFALLGADAAHFANDPLCRRWVDSEGPSLVGHTHRLVEPEDQEFGDWISADQIPETLIAVLAEIGKSYLPWVSLATANESAEIRFADGQRVEAAATPFLREARGILLARYVQHRSAALDAILERAGILSYYADHVDQASQVPDYSEPPRPELNQPFGPPAQRQA
jgi:hypothetical protein